MGRKIWSPGLLPKEINISKILEENRSIIRNKNIARIFYSVKLIENWGTGFSKMHFACKENNNPDPVFSIKTGAFVITFYKKINSEGVNEGVNEGINEGVNEGVSEGVNLLIKLIKSQPGKRTTEISEILNVPQKTIERWIKKLKETGQIVYKGSPKTGGYFVYEKVTSDE